MQRLFNMFPPGLPGLALLALRASVALALVCDSFGHATLSGWLLSAALALLVVLCAGYLTPVVAPMAIVFHGLVWWMHGIDSPFVATVVVLDALALTLLGPGAYSVDSFRFGRRVVVLPPH